MVSSAVPYCGSPPLPSTILAQWNFDPWLLLALGIAGFAAQKLELRQGPYIAGLVVLALLFISPLCALSSALFASRVTHHVVLTALAAPLLALSVRQGGKNLAGWTATHMIVFWAWHAPQFYAAALGAASIYGIMQLTLLGSAAGFWRAVLSAPPPAATGALLASMVLMGLLGALLTFAGSPLYAWHLGHTAPWGLTPLEDQQLAGLIMWVAGGVIYLITALRVLSRSLDAPRSAMAT